MARRDTRLDPKEAALAGARRLNPHPEQVTDPEFLASDFFDARDAVQVKYEMVRKVRARGAPVTEAAAAFGDPLRPAYYAAAAALESAGLDGLVPARPGPRGPPASSPRRSSPGPRSSWPPTPRCARRSCLPLVHRRRLRRARAPPVSRASAGPPPGAPLQKLLTCPPPQEKEDDPSRPCSHHLATRLLNQAPARMLARTVPPAACWTPATSSFAMQPCTRAPRRSRSGSAC